MWCTFKTLLRDKTDLKINKSISLKTEKCFYFALKQESAMTVKEFLRLLKIFRRDITRAQLCTIRGQAKAGDVEGAMRGLKRALKGRCA